MERLRRRAYLDLVIEPDAAVGVVVTDPDTGLSATSSRWGSFDENLRAAVGLLECKRVVAEIKR